MTASYCLYSSLPCSKIALCRVHKFLFTSAFNGLLLCHLLVSMSLYSRRDVKRNLEACANVTCSEILHLNAMSHVHVGVLRVANSIYYLSPYWPRYLLSHGVARSQSIDKAKNDVCKIFDDITSTPVC